MYGWLLESVQYFIVQECGEEIWETILREVGAKNTVFSTRQEYSDTLMLRLASALAQFYTKDPNSPTTSTPRTPTPKKVSLKSKPNWRSASVHADNRAHTYKCPFTATNALTAATRKEFEAFNSSEELRSLLSNISTDRINEAEERIREKIRHRRSIGVRLDTSTDIVNESELEDKQVEDKKDDNIETKKVDDVNEGKEVEEINYIKVSQQEKGAKEIKDVKNAEHQSPSSEGARRSSLKPARKTSCTVAVDVYRRRGSGVSGRLRLNSLNLGNAEKFNMLKEKFATQEKVLHFFGRCFVKFFSNYGYDTMIRATGRYFCTFLQSVDSIHQRMKSTFPNMRSPTMQLTRAHINGAALVYRTNRTGYTHYLMGQLYEIAEDIFSLKLKVSVTKEYTEGGQNVSVLRLEFDNSDYLQSLALRKSLPCPLPKIPVSLLLQLFPFGVLFDRTMKIVKAGDKIIEAWGGPYHIIKRSPLSITDVLRLRKPNVPFTWDKVISMQTMIFELELIRWRSSRAVADTRRGSQGARAIFLKGPIYFLHEIDSLIFLCSPIFNEISELQAAGLYLNDLNGHGLSKEMLLEGWQHVSRLELLFENAEKRCQSLEESHRLRDQWKKRGDQLLYSMIPKTIADHLRDGKTPMSASQGLDCVTIMFCGLQLPEASTRANVMQTVAYMNDLYSQIDRLLDKHRVYKVETVGTVYMVVSGAPKPRCSDAAAASAASAALDLVATLPMLTIGVHSGPVVATVLGLRQPRYCLVGDTVNTASRMQTTSEPGRVQISAKTAAILPAGRFRLRQRGLIKVKGKGTMETFWLEGEVGEDDYQGEALQLFSALCGDN